MRVGRGIGLNILLLVCIDKEAIRPNTNPYTHRVHNYIGEHILSSQSRENICAQYQRWQSQTETIMNDVIFGVVFSATTVIVMAIKCVPTIKNSFTQTHNLLIKLVLCLRCRIMPPS